MKNFLKFRKIIFLSLIFLIVGVGGFFAIRSIREKTSEDKINVLVTILPQKEFVEVIGGSLVNVTELIHPGADHETYSPTPQDLVSVENADVYFRIGYLTFETANIEKFKETNPNMKVVELPSDITLRSFAEGEEHDHEIVNYESKCKEFGGNWLALQSECESQSSTVLTESECDEINGEFNSCASACRNDLSANACIEVCVSVCKVTAEVHDENGIDPHVWLSIENTKKIVQSVYETLSEMSPENESFFRQNRDAYLTSLTYAKTALEKDFKGLQGSKLLVFHPAWGYFAEEFGLTQVAIEEEGKEPTAEQIQSIIDLVKAEKIKAIFVQAQFSTQTAEAIAKDTGAVIITIDPLAENYLENIVSIGDTIAKNLKTTEE